MHGFEAVIEQRIAEAARRGDFNDLPGTGRPLDLDDDLLVPEDLRMAYRILKNAGYVPPEVQTIKEIGALQRLIQTLEEGEQRSLAQRKLRLLSMQLSESRTGSLQLEVDYYGKILENLSR